MGFMDKLKNIFFEEEEDEDEEIEETKPFIREKEKKEKIAKKIEFPSIKREEKKEEPKNEVIEKKEENEITKEEINKDEPKKVKVNTELIFDDDDFIFDTKKEEIKPVVEKKPVVKKVETPIVKTREIKTIEKIEKYDKPKETYQYTKNVETRTRTFTPSPIISPIYGILDKNYKKDEVKENKEIRLTSRPSKVDFDSIRNKAFGDLEYDLFEDTKEESKTVESEDVVLEDEKRAMNKKRMERLYNSENDSKPSIDKVTIGEADEYYNDLGLAYNTDYKDLSKDQNDGKLEETNKENNLEDNLFDLIESMYDREE